MDGLIVAYINPGTGSLFLQVVLVGVAAFFVAFRSSWDVIRTFFSRLRRRP